MRASWKNNLRNWWLEKQHWFEMCLKSEIKKGLKSTQHETLLFGIFHGPFDPDGFWWSPTLGVLPVFRIKRFGFAASAARNYWPKTKMRRQWRGGYVVKHSAGHHAFWYPNMCCVNWQTNNNNMSSRFTQRRRDLAKIKDLTRCLHRSKRYQLYGVLEVFGLLAILSNLRASRAANNSICACKFFTSSRQQTIGKLEGGIGGTYLHLLLLFLDHYYPSMLLFL